MNDWQLFYGDAVKALNNSGRVGGYLIKFSNESQKDLHGEFFDPKGYYGPKFGDGAEALFEHGFPIIPKHLTAAERDFYERLADHTFQPLKTRKDALGIWAETDLSENRQTRMVIGRAWSQSEGRCEWTHHVLADC